MLFLNTGRGSERGCRNRHLFASRVRRGETGPPGYRSLVPGRTGVAREHPGPTDEETMKRLIALVAALGVAAALLITATVGRAEGATRSPAHSLGR